MIVIESHSKKVTHFVKYILRILYSNFRTSDGILTHNVETKYINENNKEVSIYDTFDNETDAKDRLYYIVKQTGETLV